MTPDECFEFDYLMQIDQESREAAAREDSARDSGVSRDYGGSGGFYGSRKSVKNSSLKINRGGIIFFVIIAILVIAYFVDKAHQEKVREDLRIKAGKVRTQELLESEANSGYEEIPTLDQEIVLNPEEIEEPKQEANPGKSPYDGCSYVGEDNQWHPCPKQSVTVEEDVDSYVPVAQIPVAQIPDTSYTPVAQIPTATTPKKTHGYYESDYDDYYDDVWYDYYGGYDGYDDHYEDWLDEYGEEYEARGFDSYDDYYWDYFDRNKADNFEDYYEVYSDYSDYGGNYDFADFRDDFYDDHYGEYFDDDGW